MILTIVILLSKERAPPSVGEALKYLLCREITNFLNLDVIRAENLLVRFSELSKLLRRRLTFVLLLALLNEGGLSR